MTKEIDDLMVKSIKDQQELIKETLRNPDVGPEARSISAKSLLELEAMIRDIEGNTRMHKKGGMVKGFSPIARPQRFKGIF